MAQAQSRTSGLTNGQMGMLVALASFGMLFGTLVMSYLLARARLPAWPPLGAEPVPPLIPLLSLPLMIGSSVCVHEAWRKFQVGDRVGFKRAWGRSMVFGFLFLLLQTLLWRALYQLGLRIDGDLYSGILYVLTGVHAAHVLAGLGALLFVWIKADRLAATSEAPQLAGWFWHFLDVVWIGLVALLLF